jgi:hypothetical protein
MKGSSEFRWGWGEGVGCAGYLPGGADIQQEVFEEVKGTYEVEDVREWGRYATDREGLERWR